jgi:hypothetical protein
MRLTSIAFLAGCAAISQTGSAAVPSPPSQICINNVCTTAKAGGTNGVIKWHPGHYALSDTRPAYPGYDFAGEIAQMAAVTAAGGGAPKMKGFVNTYSWYWLETSEGVYNWSLIDRDLAELAAQSAASGVTFKLIIQLGYESPG